MTPCIPLQPKNPDGILRVILPSRISTLKQDADNMEARQEDVEAWLRANYTGQMELLRLSEQASGWLADRPTMTEAMHAIVSGRCDVVVVSELREIYRNPAFQWTFLLACHDANVRVISLNDAIDTADENWEVITHTAVLRHGMLVPETRRRVRRKAAHSFERGGMVLRLRFGYRKLTKEEACSGRYGPVGLRIARNDGDTETIQEMRRRVLAGASPDAVADWLNVENIPPGPYAKSQRWTGRLVEALLRDPIISGLRRWRTTLYTPSYKTGKSLRSRNPQPQFKLWKELAHLTQEEQAEVIAVLDARGADFKQPTGADHPLWRRPRKDSLWPGQHAKCICTGTMYRYGKYLKCANAISNGPRTCWNHMQVDIALTQTRVLDWVFDVIDQHPNCREQIVEFAWKELNRQRQKAAGAHGHLDLRIERLRKEAENLTKAICEGGNLKALVVELTANEKATEELLRQRAQFAAVLRDQPSLSKADVAAGLRETCAQLVRSSFEFAALLRRLIPEFTIIPVQALDCPLVRPRARLTLSLAAWCKDSEPGFQATSEIDLFDSPIHIAWMTRCVERKRANPSLSLREIARELGINFMTVKRALAYARLMEANGLTDPYRVLDERPTEASRWKKRAS